MSTTKEGPLGAFDVAECPGCGGAVTWDHRREIAKETREYMHKMADDERDRQQAWTNIEHARKEIARERAEVAAARAELAATRQSDHQTSQAHDAACPACGSSIAGSHLAEIRRRASQKAAEVAREIITEYGNLEQQRLEVARAREELAVSRKQPADADHEDQQVGEKEEGT